MGFFKRTGTNSSLGSQTAVVKGSKIQTVITDRGDQPYSGDPRDAECPPPAFTRTDSYYKMGDMDPKAPAHDFLLAADVRRQVKEAPARQLPGGRYPRAYGNKPPQPLRAQPPWKEFPIVPSPQNGSPPRNYNGGEPGPVRAFYNAKKKSIGTFDVGYHDAALEAVDPVTGVKNGKQPYTLATYHQAPTYTDTAEVHRR